MADTVLLTGISGFIAGHVALSLLSAGYRVRGTVRSTVRGDAARRMLAAAGASVDRLELAVLDLERDEGWAEAARGCRYLVHTASPFPSRQPRARTALVEAARGGTVRALAAAAAGGVEKAVVTSSVVSAYLGHPARPTHVWSEADWTDVDAPDVHPYGVSKTLAERAAWETARASAMRLAVINPAFVLGPVLGSDVGTSAGIVRMMMKGRLPVVARMSLGIVDVRDVALAHRLAMERADADGRRFILSAGSRSLREMAHSAFAAARGRDLGRGPWEVPDALIRLAGRVSADARLLLPELGRAKAFDVTPAQTILGIHFRSPEQAIAATVASLAASPRV